MKATDVARVISKISDNVEILAIEMFNAGGYIRFEVTIIDTEGNTRKIDMTRV